MPNNLEERFVELCRQHRNNLWYMGCALFVVLTSSVILLLSFGESLRSFNSFVGATGLLVTAVVAGKLMAALWQENEDLGREAHEIAEKLHIEL